MSDLIIPYWMWAASLVVLALLCGAALSAQDESRREARHEARRARVERRRNWRVRW